MPYLVMTTKQAARFWGLDEQVAIEALKVLVKSGCLHHMRGGYRRS
jgi:hypothetical protein